MSLFIPTNKPKVLILDEAIDIYAIGKVDKLPSINEYKTFQKDKLILNQITIEVNNSDDFFSANNPKSIFSNINYYYKPFKIINGDDIVILDGVIKEIQRNHKTKKAKIVSIDKLYKFFNTRIEYVSADWETGAEAFKNICDLYLFTQYNNKSIEDSINQLDYNSCYLKCNFLKEDDITFQQAIEKLAELSCCDCYVHYNNIYFRHYQQYTGNPKIIVDESDLIDLPNVYSLEKELINQYNINYNGDLGVPATDDNSNNIASVSRSDYNYGQHDLPQISAGATKQIVLKDKTSATYLGECYIRRSHKNLETFPKPLEAIDFKLKYDYDSFIDLETYFKLNLDCEGWNNKIFEVFKYDIDETGKEIDITAYEVDV